jgi:hypothetical protein
MALNKLAQGGQLYWAFPFGVIPWLKQSQKTNLVMTIPARTFLLECCEWPSMRAENLSTTSFPIRSATPWGKENSATGIEVPETN